MGLIEPGAKVPVQMKPRQIQRKDLHLTKIVGTGQFGEVWKATRDELLTRNTPGYTVAAETVNESTNSSDATKDFLNEAGVMAAVGAHLNFVSLIGIITRGDPLVIVIVLGFRCVEFRDCGDRFGD